MGKTSSKLVRSEGRSLASGKRPSPMPFVGEGAGAGPSRAGTASPHQSDGWPTLPASAEQCGDRGALVRLHNHGEKPPKPRIQQIGSA